MIDAVKIKKLKEGINDIIDEEDSVKVYVLKRN